MSKELDIAELESDDLFEHFRIKVDKGQSLLRIDKFLFNKIQNTSRNRIQKTAEAGCILVNGIAVKSNYKVKPNDEVSLVLPTEPREIELIPENIPLVIIYEDNELLIINKKPGMVVHPGFGNYWGTLVNALLYHFKSLPVGNNALLRPGLVHRIDKNTTGLMVVAKTETAMAILAKEFYERTVKRSYLALVWGTPDPSVGTITANVGRSIRNRKVMDVFPEENLGKHAVTHYKVIESFGYVSLVECKLETGRTHQIRIHMKYIKHPVFNDEAYGGDKILRGTTSSHYKQFIINCFQLVPRHVLHAQTLGIKQPVTGEDLLFTVPPPDDFLQLIDKWRNYTSSRN